MSQANALISTESTPNIKIDLASRDDDPSPQLPGNEVLELPANPQRPRERPDLEDVVTQQTELLAAMLRRLNQQQQQNPIASCRPSLSLEPTSPAVGDQLPGTWGQNHPEDGHFPIRKSPHTHRPQPTRSPVCTPSDIYVTGPSG